MRGNIREVVRVVAETVEILEPIVEIGSFQVEGLIYSVDLRPLFPGKRYIGCDAREGPGVDRIENVHHLSFSDGSVGTILMMETLEHIETPLQAMDEIFRVLRPEGLVVTSSSMDYPVHEYPSDYWRFTPQGFDLLLRAFSPRRVYVQGHPDFPHSLVGVGKKGGGDEALDSLDPVITRIPGTLTQEISSRVGPDFFRPLGVTLSEEEKKKYPEVMLHVAYDRILQRDEEIERLRTELRRLTASSGPIDKPETKTMREENYKTFWEQAAVTPQQAMAAVDESADEETLQVTGRWTAEQVAHALLLQKNDHVLELGCGVARIGRELAPRCGRWQGVDISENMLKVARNRTAHLSNVDFHLLSGASLSRFVDNTFDKAYSVATLIHLDKEDLFLYLRELARVLRPGGLLYFDTWNLTHEIGWKRWLMEVEHWANSDQSQRKHVARNQFCVPEEVWLYVKKAGFTELCCLSDSPWIQMIAAKSEEGVNFAALQEQVRANLVGVAFSPLWSHLFGSLLAVLSGQKKAEDFWQELKDLGPVREVAPYHQHFLALWKTRQQEWGSAPQE